MLEIQSLHLLMLMSTGSSNLIPSLHPRGNDKCRLISKHGIMHILIFTHFLAISRLVCVCSSSGSICLLRINSNMNRDSSQPGIDVQEYARFDLQGDVFSSPVMIGGRIFVGCRDDYLHCVSVEI